VAGTVTYRPTDHRGIAVDTFSARYLLARGEVDPLLDGKCGPGLFIDEEKTDVD